MNINFGHGLADADPSVQFFNAFLPANSIQLKDVEKLYEKAPEPILMLHKNDKYTLCNSSQSFADLEKIKSPIDLIGYSDFDLTLREAGKSASIYQAEDKACMKGLYEKNHYGGIVYLPDRKLPMLQQIKKIPILSAKKPVGVVVVTLDVTEAFFNVRNTIIAEKINLPNTTPYDRLTSKQLRVLKLYNQGYSRKKGAQMLCMSEHTYAWHLREIREKFNIRTRAEMLMLEQHFE